MSATGLRRLAFSLAVYLALGVGVVLGAIFVLGNVMGMQHHSLTESSHRIHDLTFALLNGTAVVGMLAQLRAPVRHIAGQLMALIPFAALSLAVVLTNAWVLSPPWLFIGATTVLAAMFHPIGDPLRAFRGARADRATLALVAIAAVPLLAYAWTNIGLQRAGPSDHAVMGHFGFMAALSFTVVGTGLLAGTRPDGWRLPLWVAGALAIVLGITSVAYADATSSLSTVWALAAIAWGVVFIAVGERARWARPRGKTSAVAAPDARVG